MRILLASSEVFPFSKTGGLGDAVGALGQALAHAGHEVITVTPLFRGIRERFPALKRVDWQFDLALGAGREQAQLQSLEISPRQKIYFVDKPEYFDRAGIYNENGHDYRDNAERFVFFCKCIVNLAHYLPFQAEILHVHDWPAALAPLLARQESLISRWSNFPRTCLTIHNLAYQGVFPKAGFALSNLPAQLFNSETTEFYGQFNFLKAGIASADVITTVSPRYAREITTAEFGAGLDGLLRKRQAHLHGILNGVDYGEWNTTHNSLLAEPYSAADFKGKAACKAALQRELGLNVTAEIPLFGIVTRLAEQKGVDILLAALEESLRTNLQFVLQGSGAPSIEQAFRDFGSRFPGQVAIRIGYDHAMAHRIEAGCDFYLMPSRFEPCGLNQMYSLRYATIPVVRRTGGLDDTVLDILDDPAKPNGIKFSEYSPSALAKAIQKAQALFANAELLDQYRKNATQVDFSWESAVSELTDLYRG